MRKQYYHLCFVLTMLLIVPSVHAQEKKQIACRGESACMIAHLHALIPDIENEKWRDQTYRELAKTMAASGNAMDAIPLIAKIKSPDTQALTIRGIGMEAAMSGHVPNGLFSALREHAETIDHPPSYGIALTYIAMAQAFAGDNEGAWRTASEMQNAALRNKAYGETAEIQAEKGLFADAVKSISFIKSASFKDKAYKNVSRIFAQTQRYQEAFETALLISNTYVQAQAVQFILDTRRVEKEKSHQE